MLNKMYTNMYIIYNFKKGKKNILYIYFFLKHTKSKIVLTKLFIKKYYI